MQKTVVILGATGNLGSELVKAFARTGDRVMSASRAECDITQQQSIDAFFAQHTPTHIINTASYNAIDSAESNEATAMRINAQAPAMLATVAKKCGAVFVHFSSDYVFSGEEGEYTEDAQGDPVNVYGKSKWQGEEAVRAVNEQAFIVRTSKLFGRQGESLDAKPSFVTIMTKLALTQPKLTIVDEEIGCPTYTYDLAAGVVELLSGEYVSGTYHLVNEDEGKTWFGFAEEIFDVLSINPERTAVSSAAFPRPAVRPKNVILKNTKGPKLPSRRDALERFLCGPLKAGIDIQLTGIPGLFAFTPKRLGDERGWFSETLNFALLRDFGMQHAPTQINEGQSLKGIVRGLHFQAPPFAQTKIVSCTAGRIFDVAVDIRKNSPTYGKWFGLELSAQNGTTLYIPEGFAHGMMALEDGSRIRYHLFGSGWERSAEGGLRYNDPEIGIIWPEIDVPVSVNARDASWQLFSELQSPFIG
ncbi:MAG: dTDP-4-dehydrorhamnose reductase [Patescibacteria group bacterium]